MGMAEKTTSRGQMIETKIELLESMTAQVSNRRSRRWLNDRLLLELVPRLNAEEIRGLFAPPPWGDQMPTSAFCMTDFQDWETFRNIDMDREAVLLKSFGKPSKKGKGSNDSEKVIALTAWHRVGRRTREVLRRHIFSDIVQGYEECIKEFIRNNTDEDVMVLHVQDAFHRLLLHGVCEFYDLVSSTETRSDGAKMTTVKRKKSGSQQIPLHITMVAFLNATRQGIL